MSYDKETVNNDSIPEIIARLEQSKIPYTLDLIGSVTGWGCNDLKGGCNRKKYKCYRLQFKDSIYINQMQRNEDCDNHDYFVSLFFLPEKEKDFLGIEVYAHDENTCHACCNSPTNICKDFFSKPFLRPNERT